MRAGQQRYELVKKRTIEQIKKNNVDNARAKKDEKVNWYAHQLEKLARSKFPNDTINLWLVTWDVLSPQFCLSARNS